MRIADALVSGGLVWLGIIVGAVVLVGLAAIWVRLLRWAIRVNELVALAGDTLHELRKISAHMTGYVVQEPGVSIRSVPEAPLGSAAGDAPKTCPRCRLANSPGATHCEKCGAPL